MPKTEPSRVRPAAATVAKVTEELAKRFGNRLVTSQAVREQHANTLTWQKNEPPDAV
ncbi:MAG: FAD-binding oxidoreductase, partial [Hyphomicrobiales bacterium]|nr:FAD-binding oxidoreductase [Hyphomicrobiales bacterium]